MNENQTTILVVDDEFSIRASLRTILTGLGFAVVEAARGEEAVALVRTARLDVVLLDINMPGLGGVEVCRQMRKIAPLLPILMLTVQSSEDRKVEALEAGADDYVTKPFPLRELIARIRVAVRHNRTLDGESSEILIGDVRLDVEGHIVQKGGKIVHLTPKQFDLLHYLMANAGKPIPHAKLLRSVWGPEYGNELEYLRTFVRQVRMKIEDDPANPTYLLTESHIGYRFSKSL
ncbi:MAG TPA: response regulator transcription factor [Terracidiphilus sp.]|nr:response regulator transcription factor [Terracidiphilus sp.]